MGEGKSMAMYHLRVKFVKRSEGKSAVAAAAYRSGTKLHDERENKTHDYTRKSDIEYSEIMLPEGIPISLQERETLWNSIETGIKHPRGQPAFEVEAALPRELSKQQCVALVREFARDQFVARGVPVDINIHRTTASDGGEHPHVHFLISTRRFEPDGSIGKAARDMQDNPQLVNRVYALEDAGRLDEALAVGQKTNLMHWRRTWEDYSNRFLEDSGSESRIDHRTLAAQDIEREPQPHIGFAIYHKAKEFSERIGQRLEQWKEITGKQWERVKDHMPDQEAEFIAIARDYFPKLFPEFQHEKELEREQDIEQ